MTRDTQVNSASQYDVVVVGAGPAGLSAALMLGRARRSVLVIDEGRPRNAPAAHLHGFLSRDGVPPGDLLQAGRREVESYGGTVQAGQAVSAVRDGDGFAIELDTGRTVRARRLLATAGVVDELPDVPGLAPRWGRDVVHCPYCHGWEIRDQPIGVLATGPLGVQQALLFRQWTDRLTLLLHTAPRPTHEEAEQLAARRITVVDGKVTGLEVAEDRLTGVRLASGRQIPLRALAVAPQPHPRADFLTGLGLGPTAHPSGLGTSIAADATGLTTVPGVWVAGNLADPNANVLASAASGSTAAGAINSDLIAEDTRHAVRAHRDPFSPAMEARVCEQVLGDRRHGL
ncbi:NAD(P)/FAD-dependent oxidoreductase [Streptomyces boncukensis]|uniref:NAD(P)/FAD-dependent oxidoreductase n=1 Tax=Streptomyces boncukensis TaxID=2711219 RepID=A0A6G4X465_9ACTN|nr:NAD(P)/FAD-dependent oxidoreductase [Streptomyces boncukensis]NGO72043.1 NAD(P)/FAD-dependent oxidoreductase [Streptomyces boncukensis]